MKSIYNKDQSELVGCLLWWKYQKLMQTRGKYYKELSRNFKKIEINKLEKELFLSQPKKKLVHIN